MQKIRKVFYRLRFSDGTIRTAYDVEVYDAFYEGWQFLRSPLRWHNFKSKAERDEWVRLYLAINKGKVKLCKDARLW